MLKIAIDYRTVEQGLQALVLPLEKRATPEQEAEIDRAVGAWLAGETQPIFVDASGANVAGTRKVAQVEQRTVDGKRGWVQTAELPADASHVVAAKLWARNEYGIDHDPATHEEFTPYVRVVMVDGSAAHLPLVPAPKAKAAGKGTKGEAA